MTAARNRNPNSPTRLEEEMSEEPTEKFNGESFETRVLAELAALRSSTELMEKRLTSVEGRVASLELKVDALDEKVDARLRDTRPIWESVLSQLKMIDTKFDVHAHDMLELRAKMRELEKRVPPAA